jgi:hypothetical protein
MRRQRGRLDRQRAGAGKVLARLRQGASLRLSFERGASCWRLSDGTPVSEDVAKIVIADHRVVAAGDALFRNLLCQTYRFIA